MNEPAKLQINASGLLIALGVYFLLRALGVALYAAAATALLGPPALLALLSLLGGPLEHSRLVHRIDGYLLARQDRQRQKRVAETKRFVAKKRRERDELIAKRTEKGGDDT